MNSIDVFSIALGLESPWSVRDVKFESSLENSYKELHIWIAFAKGSSFKIEDDSSSKAYETENKVLFDFLLYLLSSMLYILAWFSFLLFGSTNYAIPCYFLAKKKFKRVS